MDLIKKNWNKKDIEEFQKYLKTFENNSKKEWSSNLLNTELPVLAISSLKLKEIGNEIYKGNYLEFLNYMLSEYYENTIINGYIITKIKDSKLIKTYLDKYSLTADNWATCDVLSFDVRNQEENFYNLSLEYIKDPRPFKRRIGIRILFHLLDNIKYVDKIFNILNSFSNEEHYYVNMINAWLLCELFIKYRTKTIEYFRDNKLNKFTINKAIQKCRESRRVSIEDKEMLLKYKLK